MLIKHGTIGVGMTLLVGLFRIAGAVMVGGAITCYVEGIVPD